MHALMRPHGRDLDDLAQELATDLDDGLSEPAGHVALEDVQVGATDRGGVDADDHVRRLLDEWGRDVGL